MPNPLVTLTTDFGPATSYVGMMKGVILRICPEATVVDLDHTIEPQQILSAAFVLDEAVRYFPAHAVHVAVVDPGVGSERKVIVVDTPLGKLVGPDNGIFSLVLERCPEGAAYEVTDESMCLDVVSDTFHGRDIFAPVAAHLAAGNPVAEVGPVLSDPVVLPWQATMQDDGACRGQVVRIDRFGNLVTNITERDVAAVREGKMEGLGDISVGVAGVRIDSGTRTFSDAAPGETIYYLGSTGYLEIAKVLDDARKALGVRLGDEVVCW